MTQFSAYQIAVVTAADGAVTVTRLAPGTNATAKAQASQRAGRRVELATVHQVFEPITANTSQKEETE